MVFSWDNHRFANTVAFHPDGNCIGVGTTDNVVKVTNTPKMLKFSHACEYISFRHSDLGYQDEQVVTALFRYTLCVFMYVYI